MSGVSLTGQVICRDADEAGLVGRYLPAHIELTRAEPGCLWVAVTASDDPLVWRVDELFVDSVAFRSHQTRVAGSAWGRHTAAIRRVYSIVGLEDSPNP